MVVDIVPQFVPAFFQSMYVPVLYGGLIVAFIGLMGIAIEKRDIQILILTDLAGLAMLIIVAAVGTDLAEALVLPKVFCPYATQHGYGNHDNRSKLHITGLDRIWYFPIWFYRRCGSRRRNCPFRIV